uniref:Uncharacterized protein n=1 Tax=Anopheles maculatus TaxID=74869 RepID=A0A182S9Z5_9DIPT
MLPMIVTYMKSDALSSMEQDAFEHIYGSIWELVVEESQRHRGQPRNAILTALLASPELRQTPPENPTKLNNDITHNAIPKEFKTKAQTSVSHEGPAQRVLHTAAAIVQKYYQRQAKHKINSKRKTPPSRRTQRLRSANVHTKQLSADSIRVTIELPRYKPARHRAIQQQRLKQRQHLAYRKSQSNRHSSYEDY